MIVLLVQLVLLVQQSYTLDEYEMKDRNEGRSHKVFGVMLAIMIFLCPEYLLGWLQRYLPEATFSIL